MNSENEQAVKWLKSFVDSISVLSALAKDFRQFPYVDKVFNELNAVKIAHSLVDATPHYGFEYYVDVFLKNGNAICWHLDVAWDEEKWIISSYVTVPGKYGARTIRAFPNRTAPSVEAFIVELKAATSQLLECSELIETQR